MENTIFSGLIYFKPYFEIAILWFVVYHIMLFFEGTRAIHVVRGIAILIVAFLLFQKLELEVLNWLLTKLFAISVLAILVIFQPEIRQGLARLGQRNLFGTTLREEEVEFMLKEIYKAVDTLSKNKVGALIAIEKKDPLTPYIESGVLVDARLSADLLQTVFTPNNPLHDGGVIIQHGRVMAAGCLFPLSQNNDLSRIFGTRHRAALGLSEDTDAIVIVVSEERQDISFVYKGRLYKDLSQQDLLFRVKELLKVKTENA